MKRQDMDRFEFGKNWASFLKTLNQKRIDVAQESLKEMLEVKDIEGKSFLDIGCGSGLFSLAAKNMGARHVRSFDYDEQAVRCAQALKQNYYADDKDWLIDLGDVLDSQYVDSLGRFDFVYSYGVLHHTGDMLKALANTARTVEDGGKLVIAIYNDQGNISKMWLAIKKLYNRLPIWAKPVFTAIFVPGAEAPYVFQDLKNGKVPWSHWSEYYQRRGMSRMHDIIDWVGGLPFEVARPDQIFDLFRSKGFRLDRLITCGGGHDNNQFVFTKSHNNGLAVGYAASDP